MGLTKFKEMIFESAVEGIIKLYGFDEKTSKKLVVESGLDWAIKVAPDMVMG